MAQDADIPVPGGDWVLLTDSDVTAVSFAVVGGSEIVLQPSTIGASHA